MNLINLIDLINKINLFQSNKLFETVIGLIITLGIIEIVRRKYYQYCISSTFERLDRLYPRKFEWEKELQIYSISLSKFYTGKKKSKCVLLISGYRDIPYVFDKILNYFESNSIDYYAPRTHGNGRSFFQSCDSTDWIITYLEALKVLEQQYEQVDIIAFSTGCIIALYLTQEKFTYKCKISNLILCAPFLIEYPDIINYLVFSSPIVGSILRFFLQIFLPLRMKSLDNYKYPRDTNWKEAGEKDYYELAGFFELECKLFDFKKFRPGKIKAENVVILYPNDDRVIGSINEQKNIIESAWDRPLSIITIPNYSNPSPNTLPSKCAHVMFKEDPIIVSNIIENILKFIK